MEISTILDRIQSRKYITSRTKEGEKNILKVSEEFENDCRKYLETLIEQKLSYEKWNAIWQFAKRHYEVNMSLADDVDIADLTSTLTLITDMEDMIWTLLQKTTA